MIVDSCFGWNTGPKAAQNNLETVSKTFITGTRTSELSALSYLCLTCIRFGFMDITIDLWCARSRNVPQAEPVTPLTTLLEDVREAVAM